MTSIAAAAFLMGLIITIITSIVRYINHKRAVSITTKMSQKEGMQKEPSEELKLIDVMNLAIKSSSFPFGFGEYNQYSIFFFPEYFIEIADNIPANIENIRSTLEKLSPQMLARVKPEFINQILPENSAEIYEKASNVTASNSSYEISFANGKLKVETFIYDYIKERYPDSIPYLLTDNDQIAFIENSILRVLFFAETTIDKTIDFFTEKSHEINKENNKTIFDYKLQLHKFITTIAELEEISNEKIALLYACKDHETYEKERLRSVYPAISALNEKKNIILCETRIGSFTKSDLNDFLKEANIKNNGVLAIKEGKIIAFEKFAGGNQFIPAKKILSEILKDEIRPKWLISDLQTLLDLTKNSVVLCFIENFISECEALSNYKNLKNLFTAVLRNNERQNKIKIRWVYTIQNNEVAHFLTQNKYPKKGIFVMYNGKVLRHKKYNIFTLIDAKIKYAKEILDSLNLSNMSKNTLPNIIDCPICGVELELEENERRERTFICPNCNKLTDLNKMDVE